MEIVFHQVGRIFFRRRGAGAEVENPADILQGVRFDATKQLRRVEIIFESQGHKVAPLFIRAHDIGDDDALESPAIEFPNERAADEAGRAGHEDEVIFLHAKKSVRSRVGSARWWSDLRQRKANGFEYRRQAGLRARLHPMFQGCNRRPWCSARVVLP